MKEPVIIVDYDPAWLDAFERERQAIVDAMGGAMSGVIAIEHVGSTSVPGCSAKPVIDIAIAVRGAADGLRCITPMVSLGYECVGEAGVPGRIYFRKGRPRSHHVHLVEHASEFWERHLAFRDALRARPDLVRKYGEIKRRLAAEFQEDRVGYTEAKSPFIEAVLAEAE